MKIENQVCTLEQAKRLAELKVGETGFPLFVWVPEFPVFNDKIRLCSFDEFESRLKNCILSDEARALVGYYPAFTVAELGVMLPDGCNIGNYAQIFSFKTAPGATDRQYKKWICEIVESELNEEHDTIPLYVSSEDTEAECRADMLIYLLENNLVTAEDCNKRLAA